MNRPIHLWFRRFLAALVGRVLVLPVSGAALRFAFIGESLFLCAFGALISTGQAGAAAPFFDGAQDAKSRAVMRQAGLDIEKYRKGSFTLELVDARGNPVQAEVQVELRQHAFKFGTNLFGLSAMPDSELKRTAFAAAKAIFNTGVVCDYWRSPDRKEQERKRDQPLEDLRWAEAMEFYKQAPNYPQFRDPAVGKQVLAMARR
jgi:hypothetical protein